jgi:hypothetical protein
VAIKMTHDAGVPVPGPATVADRKTNIKSESSWQLSPNEQRRPLRPRSPETAPQCSTAQSSAVLCSAVQCSVVQCSGWSWEYGGISGWGEISGLPRGWWERQCSAVQCSAVQCSAVQCSAVQCSAVHYIRPEQCSAVQCSAENGGTKPKTCLPSLPLDRSDRIRTLLAGELTAEEFALRCTGWIRTLTKPD